jgi:hypothetical protein
MMMALPAVVRKRYVTFRMEGENGRNGHQEMGNGKEKEGKRGKARQGRTDNKSLMDLERRG